MMIKKLTFQDIRQVVKIHRGELPGFLSQLGEGFLMLFYRVSIDIPEMFTLVEKENEQILGFVTGTTSTKGLYKRILMRDFLSFIWSFLGNLFTHPRNIVRAVRILTYPGFADDSPELLTMAIKKDYQGRGIGSKLFKEAATNFKKRGFKKIRVSVYDKLPANNFYKKMGCKLEKSFEFLGEKMNYYIFPISLVAQRNG